MFEHKFERDIASTIINDYNSREDICNNNSNRACRIGITITDLLFKLNITCEIITYNDKIELLTESNVLTAKYTDTDFIDCDPIITKDTNNHEIKKIKSLQTINFLDVLEKNNLICIFEDNHINSNLSKIKKECYETTTITDVNSVKFIKRISNSRIIPTTGLIEISNHDFKSEEKRQYEKQLEISEQALDHAKWSSCSAILIAIFSMTLTLIIALTVPTRLCDDTIQDLGKEIRESKKIPAKAANIKTTLIDTLNNEQIKNAKP